jgi:hypothetical protein
MKKEIKNFIIDDIYIYDLCGRIFSTERSIIILNIHDIYNIVRLQTLASQ